MSTPTPETIVVTPSHTAGPRFIVHRAARVIREGGVIAHPTEGVYGLACDPNCIEAVQRILRIKARQSNKGLILLAHSVDALEPFCAPLDDALTQRLQTPTAHPTTYIIPAARDLNPLLNGGRQTLAVRITEHAFSRALCELLGHPIVSTSANRGGKPAALRATVVRRELGADVDLVVSGPLGGAQGPSEIRDVVTGELLRAAIRP